MGGVSVCVFTKNCKACGLESEVIKPEISAPGQVIAESLLLINNPMKPLQTYTIMVTLCYWAVKSHSERHGEWKLQRVWVIDNKSEDLRQNFKRSRER